MLIVALVVSACGPAGQRESNDDRAGGLGLADPKVLTFALPGGGPPTQLEGWAAEVSRFSGGTLEIEFVFDWRKSEVKYEAGTIEDVKRGEVDLAWVGARAFDIVGVNSFQPLVAPMLIDSYDLQGAVFEAGIPRQMLDGLETIDLVGIGVLPGPMRKMLGVNKPFVRTADFIGMVVGIQDSGVAIATLTAVGAIPRPVPAQASLDGLDGYEQQLGSIANNNYPGSAGYVTSNLNLWPRPLVIFANSDVFDSLSPGQQDALREATSVAMPEALAASRAEDESALPYLCDQGMVLTVANETDISELRTAFEPIYAEIGTDPATKAYLEAIVAVKTELAAPPETPACAQIDPPEESGQTEISAGTYERTMTRQQAIDGCLPDLAEYDETILQLTIDPGSFEIWVLLGGEDGQRVAGAGGTYSLYRDRIEFDEPGFEPWTARWSFDGTNLIFTDIDPPVCDVVAVMGTDPWVLTSAADEAASAFPDGTYESTLTVEDWSGVDGTTVGVFTMLFDSGEITLVQPETGEIGFKGTYTVFRDRIEAKDNVDTVTARWTFDGEELTFNDISPSDSPFEVVWGSHPWVMVDGG